MGYYSLILAHVLGRLFITGFQKTSYRPISLVYPILLSLSLVLSVHYFRYGKLDQKDFYRSGTYLMTDCYFLCIHRTFYILRTFNISFALVIHKLLIGF
jgi:hypothetical protein